MWTQDEVRDGDARALTRLYSVLVNEFVLLTSSDDATVGTLTSAQFHAVIDGALRHETGVDVRPRD